MFVSIITPSNRLENLKTCYNNLKTQTDKNFEWVVIVEKDNIPSIKFLKSIKDIKVLVLLNKFKIITKIMNYAVSKSKGNIISWLGDDDFLETFGRGRRQG